MLTSFHISVALDSSPAHNDILLVSRATPLKVKCAIFFPHSVIAPLEKHADRSMHLQKLVNFLAYRYVSNLESLAQSL